MSCCKLSRSGAAPPRPFEPTPERKRNQSHDLAVETAATNGTKPACAGSPPHVLPSRRRRLSIFCGGRPSRRRQQRAAPQGERLRYCFVKIIFVYPEEVLFFWTVSKCGV